MKKLIPLRIRAWWMIFWAFEHWYKSPWCLDTETRNYRNKKTGESVSLKKLAWYRGLCWDFCTTDRARDKIINEVLTI